MWLRMTSDDPVGGPLSDVTTASPRQQTFAVPPLIEGPAGSRVRDGNRIEPVVPNMPAAARTQPSRAPHARLLDQTPQIHGWGRCDSLHTPNVSTDTDIRYGTQPLRFLALFRRTIFVVQGTAMVDDWGPSGLAVEDWLASPPNARGTKSPTR